MLIYNYKKEFLGIDEADLKALGLNNLAELRAESGDFADLFVKTPGCIHNFKHVHWIDYVLDDSGTEPKAVINIKGKNYSTNIIIKTIYLVDNPSKEAYIVELSNLRVLSSAQLEKLSKDISKKQPPRPAVGSTELFTTPGSIEHDEYSRANKDEAETVTYDPYETKDSTSTIGDIYETDTPTVEDYAVDEPPLKIDIEEKEEAKKEDEQETYKAPEPEVETSAPANGEISDYVYDPHVASEELGLPVDLIQEFIQDFIAQAESFKEDLYESAKNNDLNHLKIQSHKLKGVAANLRILNALDALTTINSSEDYEEIKTNLDNLYLMVSKLSQKPSSAIEKVNEVEKVEDKDEEEEFVLSFKDKSTYTQEPKVEKVEDKAEGETDFANDVILDSDVPKSISIPELADDEFLNSQNTEFSTDDMLTLNDDLELPSDSDNDNEPEVDVYNKESIADEFGLDIESFNELLDDFITESKELSDTIVQSAKENNLSSCKSMAIKMKGMSDNMRIHKFDSELEDIINATTTKSVKDLAEVIKSKLNQISDKEV